MPDIKYYTEHSLTGNTNLLIEDNIYLNKATSKIGVGFIGLTSPVNLVGKFNINQTDGFGTTNSLIRYSYNGYEIMRHYMTSSWDNVFDSTNSVGSNTNFIFYGKGTWGVGIDVVYPLAKFHVKGAVGTYGQLVLDSTTTTEQTGFALLQGGLQRWQLYVPPSTTDFKMYNATLGSVPFNIDSDATSNLLYLKGSRIGIGTSAPGNTVDIRSSLNSIVGIDIWNFSGGIASAAGISFINNNVSESPYIGYTSSNWTDKGGINTFLVHSSNRDFAVVNNTLEVARFKQDGKVGIGTLTPSEKLVISGGTIQIVNGSQGVNKVLTSDANGVATWSGMTSTLPQIGANYELIWTDIGETYGYNATPKLNWNKTENRLVIEEMTNLSGQTLLSTDHMALSSLRGGAFFGRNKITENQFYLTFEPYNWYQSNSDLLNWKCIAMSSDGKFQSACVDGDSIYTSVDYGRTWNISTSDKLSWTSIAMSSDGKIQSACAMNPLWGGDGIYTSNDYGVTWTRSGSIDKNWGCIAMSSDGKIQSAGCDYLYISNNYGLTWRIGAVDLVVSSISMSSDGKIQSACVGGGYIWISNDYGVTWIQSGSDSKDWTSITMSSDGKIQSACAGGGYIWISNDYGVTWIQSGSDSKDWTSIAMSSDGKIQIACAVSDYIYLSNDYGVTWLINSSISGVWTGIAMSSDGKIQSVCASSDYIYYSYATSNLNGNLVITGGTIQIVDGTQSDGYILTSDPSGVGSWQPPTSSNSGGFWSGSTESDIWNVNSGSTGRVIVRGGNSGEVTGLFTISGNTSKEKLLTVNNNVDFLAVDGEGVIVNGNSDPDVDFRAAGDTDTYLLRTDADNNRVGIGGSTSTLNGKLHIKTPETTIPSVYLEQPNYKPFIHFSGVTVTTFSTNPSGNTSTYDNSGTNLSAPHLAGISSGGWVLNCMIRISTSNSPSGDLWIPAYNIDPQKP